jgi:Ca-activated chloride channel homolog
MKTIQTFLLVATLAIPAAPGIAQSYRGLVNDANEAYRQEKYDVARDGYSKATQEKSDRIESWFNSGNTSYRTDDIQAALKQYEEAGKRARNKEEVAGAMFNAGNVFLNAAEKGADNPVLKQAAGGDAAKLRMEGYRQAIGLYKQALKLNPSDADARYNLTYARKKLEELQQQQQQNQNQNQDKKQEKQDKEQDQQNQDKSKQEEQQKKDQQDQQQQQQQNQKDQQQKDQAKQNQQQQQQKQPQMSKQQAEQILRALERQEKDLQKEKRQQVPVRIQVEKDW